MTEQYFRELESRLAHLLELSASALQKTELDEVRRFTEACEYGLALETFVDIVAEENKQISAAAASVVYELVDTMGLSREKFEATLRGRVMSD